MKDMFETLRDGWRIDAFAPAALATYARERLLDETRNGIAAMSLVMLALVVTGLLLSFELGFDRFYLYGYAAVAALALHIHLSVRQVDELHTLHLLGITLLVVSATAFVFIAHGTHAFSTLLFSNVLLLFMAVPMVPWGTREAVAATGLLYLLLSASVGGVSERFTAETLVTLQFLMLGAAAISLLLVVRGVHVRRNDLRARYALEAAQKNLFELSNRDALTGAWNRRFMGQAVSELNARHAGTPVTFELAVIDLDDFKQLNDTWGHDFGDLVLKVVTATLVGAVGEDGYVFRFGGDEFVVFQVGAALDERLAEAATAVREHPALLKVTGAQVAGMSYGVARAALTPGLDVSAAYRSADRGLYAAKQARGAARAAG
ncbi:MAG: GGDEF domain-containing protein [Gammaproteobacteria bacterium]